MKRTLKQLARAVRETIRRWRYRSSRTGQFLSKEEYDRLPPETTVKERIK